MATPKLLDDHNAEIDTEGVAVDGDAVYVIRSHSLARTRVKADRSFEENRDRTVDVKERPHCKRLFRLRINDHGKITSQHKICLSDLLVHDPLFKRSAKIPSNENGIDIEEIAAAEGRLTVGLRGPVLRGNYVPLMQFDFERPAEYKLRFIPLGGRGTTQETAEPVQFSPAELVD